MAFMSCMKSDRLPIFGLHLATFSLKEYFWILIKININHVDPIHVYLRLKSILYVLLPEREVIQTKSKNSTMCVCFPFYSCRED